MEPIVVALTNYVNTNPGVQQYVFHLNSYRWLFLFCINMSDICVFSK